MSQARGERGREKILAYLIRYGAEHSYPPSVREILRECGFTSSSSVAHHLRVLEDRGDVVHWWGLTRTVRVTG